MGVCLNASIILCEAFSKRSLATLDESSISRILVLTNEICPSSVASCDPHRIHEISKTKKCVVYSLGSNNDFTFERSILERLPLCEIHTFDHTIVLKKERKPEEVHFHSWGIGSEDSGKFKTLNTIRRVLGHDNDETSIEILKMDIEGSEWKTIIPALENNQLGWARQLLIELHPRKIEVMRPLWELLKEQGWVTQYVARSCDHLACSQRSFYLLF